MTYDRSHFDEDLRHSAVLVIGMGMMTIAWQVSAMGLCGWVLYWIAATHFLKRTVE